MEFVAAAAGLVALFAGGESLVRGAAALARSLGLPPLVIGLTVVSAATSSPELLVTLRAAATGHPDIAIGNVLGSNIANLTLVLGLSAVLAPVRVHPSSVRADVIATLSGTLVVGVLAAIGSAPSWAGGLLLAAGISHIAGAYRRSLAERNDLDLPAAGSYAVNGWPLTIGQLAGGVALLAVGADWLVWGAQIIARDFGVPEAAIAATLVAVGTSLPEIATSLVAAWRGHSDVAVGNAIGSNVFNVFAVLGSSAAVAPMIVSPRFGALEVPLLLVLTLVVGWALAVRGRLGRVGGLLLFACYAVYARAVFAV
ncbi:MAG: calcium/sodium antiporter [Anaerosomatales bacterium]|nr:calcium/sodium antiporter [Anaerosomatales bacterium]